MNLEVHILARDEEDFMPYALRHWTSIADRVIVHDAGSVDRTHEICRQYGVELRHWKTDGVNDKLAKELKETAWIGTDADAVAMVDCDELLYFPDSFFHTMVNYDVPVVKPRGFEMFSDVFPTTEMQVYDEVKLGAEDAQWYAKSVLFFPSKVKSIVFSAGAHETWATLHDGTKWESAKEPIATPETYFLHFHQLGPLERIANRYDRQRKRLSQTNVNNKWGNFDPPLVHAKDKRALIAPKLRQVIA